VCFWSLPRKLHAWIQAVESSVEFAQSAKFRK
jgi:hypothetical protein